MSGGFGRSGSCCPDLVVGPAGRMRKQRNRPARHLKEVVRRAAAFAKANLEVVAVAVGHGENVEALIELLLGEVLAVDEAEVDDGFADSDLLV